MLRSTAHDCAQHLLEQLTWAQGKPLHEVLRPQLLEPESKSQLEMMLSAALSKVQPEVTQQQHESGEEQEQSSNESDKGASENHDKDR